MSVSQRAAQARASSASRPSKPIESAAAASRAAVGWGLAESWEVAIPTALVNSYVFPASAAKSNASDAWRGPLAPVMAIGLAVERSRET